MMESHKKRDTGGREIKEYPETHQKGYISIENIPDKGLIKGDLGIQVASDGRVWICIDGAAFLRFRPALKGG